jgi:hypothetical protein
VRGFVIAGIAAAVFACCAGVARADVATVADDGSTPFDGGVAVTSPLEALAGSIASTVAGRPVSVRCESDADWAMLAQNGRFAPAQVLGYVAFVGNRALDYAELSPLVCRSLQTFASATTKPTKCATTTSEPQTATHAVREKVVKLVNGKRVVSYRTRAVPSTTYVQVAQPPTPCFANGRQLANDNPFWDSYFSTAEALQTLVHEAIHLQGNPVEAQAECYGMQSLAYAAQQLGDTPDDAAAIAAYYVTQLYPARQTQTPDYWSADCRPNGALDLTPNDGVWP